MATKGKRKHCYGTERYTYYAGTGKDSSGCSSYKNYQELRKKFSNWLNKYSWDWSFTGTFNNKYNNKYLTINNTDIKHWFYKYLKNKKKV